MADLYNLSSHYWAGNVISLHAATASGHVFATVPLNFVVGNGVNTWEYILDLAEMLVEPVTDCPGSIETVDGDAVHLAAEPCAGDYVFTHRGIVGFASPIVYAAGPCYKSKFKTATTASLSSSISSSRSPTSHTGTMRWNCESAHIVPKLREDVYRELLGIPLLARAPVYDVASGVLLSRNLHHRYDRLEWSFYYKNNAYYVHFFVTSQHSIHHGKAIPISAFRVKFAYQLPNPKLRAWHYAQCARAHIRGFPVELSAAQRTADLAGRIRYWRSHKSS